MFLILTQQALQSGLITAFVGGLEKQSAPVLVYSVDGQRTLQGSVIPPPLEEAIRAVPDDAEAGRIGQGTYPVQNSRDDEESAAEILGVEVPALGLLAHPSPARTPEDDSAAAGSQAAFPARRHVTGLH